MATSINLSGIFLRSKKWVCKLGFASDTHTSPNPENLMGLTKSDLRGYESEYFYIIFLQKQLYKIDGEWRQKQNSPEEARRFLLSVLKGFKSFLFVLFLLVQNKRKEILMFRSFINSFIFTFKSSAHGQMTLLINTSQTHSSLVTDERCPLYECPMTTDEPRPLPWDPR